MQAKLPVSVINALFCNTYPQIRVNLGEYYPINCFRNDNWPKSMSWKQTGKCRQRLAQIIGMANVLKMRPMPPKPPVLFRANVRKALTKPESTTRVIRRARSNRHRRAFRQRLAASQGLDRLDGARGRTRTDTILLPGDFESPASTIPPLGPIDFVEFSTFLLS